MQHPRSYGPAGPRWTASELLAARRALQCLSDSMSTPEDRDVAAALWGDWWQDLYATFGTGCWLGMLSWGNGRQVP